VRESKGEKEKRGTEIQGERERGPEGNGRQDIALIEN
jgi:hypothetical protein